MAGMPGAAPSGTPQVPASVQNTQRKTGAIAVRGQAGKYDQPRANPRKSNRSSSRKTERR